MQDNPSADHATKQLKRALYYAGRGWHVCPLHVPDGDGCSCHLGAKCTNVGKHPCFDATDLPDGIENATVDPELINTWWTRWPGANIAVATGQRSGLVVFDVDPRHGGEEEWAALVRDRAPVETVQAITGSGGAHYYFTHPGFPVKNRSGFRPGVDVRGDGGYVVAPCSLHQRGEYRWELSSHPSEVPIVPLPEWLLDQLREPAPTSAAGPIKATIPEGERNTTLTKIAGGMRRQGMEADEILVALRATNEKRCVPPLPETELECIARSVGRYTPEQATEWRVGAQDTQLADGAGLTEQLGNTILAVRQFARDEGGELYHFQDGAYRPKGKEEVLRLIASLMEHLGKSWTVHRGNEVAAWIQLRAPVLWERPPLDRINLQNGILDLNSRQLLPHTPSFLSPIQLPVQYDPGASCPLWKRFIETTFPQDAWELAYEIVAWLMTPDTSIKKAILAHGDGDNGKSVWISALIAFLGAENIHCLSLQQISEDRFAKAALMGKLANLCADIPSTHLMDTAAFKTLTGGDWVSGERKYGGTFQFRPYCRLIFSANHLPRSNDASAAFFDRWVVIPFSGTFAEGAAGTIKRSTLDEWLRSPQEQSGLLNEALRVLPDVRSRGLRKPASVEIAWNGFRKATDPLAAWLDENTVRNPDGLVIRSELYSRYIEHCKRSGLSLCTQTAFTPAVERHRPEIEKAYRVPPGRSGSLREHCWVGLSVRKLDSCEDYD